MYQDNKKIRINIKVINKKILRLGYKNIIIRENNNKAQISEGLIK